LEKWKKGRGYGQNNHLLPPSLTIQRRRRQGGRPWKGGGAPVTWCTATAGKWGKRRGGRGQPILLLTSGCGAPERRIDGGGRRPVMVVGGGGAWGLGRQGGLVGVVRGEVVSRSGPFIGAERWFGEDILSFAELQWPAMEVWEKSRRGLRPAGFSVDCLLCELTRRAGLLWPWRGGRRGSNGGRFGGDSSPPGLRVSGRGWGRCCLADCGAAPGVLPWRARSAGR
jgi:hypothetical protein